MSMGILAAFVAACIFLAITPGPNMSLIIANTSAHGLRGGLWTLAGSTTGFSILVGIAALGMTSVMVLMADWFDVIRWVGAAYLVYLGARQLYAAVYPSGSQTVRLPRSGALYVNGLVVSLSNPKVLLFLGAFLPQFVDPSRGAAVWQFLILGTIFNVSGTLVNALVALLAGRLGEWLRKRPRLSRTQQWFTGGVFLALGTRIALAGRG
jgi:threonine/homoserine/homoserine lactone efflux protein